MLEHPRARAQRRRQEAKQRRDECMDFAMQRKSRFAQSFWLWIADTQEAAAERELRNMVKRSRR